MVRRTLSISAAVVFATFYSTIGKADDGIVVHEQSAFELFEGRDETRISSAPNQEDAAVAPTEKDYSIQTSSISTRPMFNDAGVAGGLADEDIPLCLDIKAPPARLQTQSKYRSDDFSKSAIDGEALATRDKTVQPIRDSIRLLTNVAYAQSSSSAVMQARADCVLRNLDRWATEKSLTDMRSTDAYLTRDRWISEIALALNYVSKRVELTSERKELYSMWLGAIARDTIDAYSLRLGPKSKTNNHRYWAGLSVAAVGFVVDDQDLKQWGKTSFEIGACQVDDRGFLPAELARGERALEYHVYALRPLAAILKLAVDNGEPIQPKCLGGYERLTAQTRESLKDTTAFEQVAGLRQTTNIRESSYSDALKLSELKVF